MTRLAVILATGAYAVFGQTASSPERFEIASIKPNSQGGADVQGKGDIRILPGGRMTAERAQLRYFIQIAYGVKPFQLLGGPGWIDSAHYDIDAKAEGNPSGAQMGAMMQTLLKDRFQLQVHRETKQLPVYELTIAKSGSKLEPPKEGNCVASSPNAPPSPPRPGGPAPCGRVLMTMSPSGARMAGGNVTIAELIRVLSNVLERTVIDKTGFAGKFDVHLEFAADEALTGVPRPPARPDSGGSTAAADPGYPSIFSAIQEQLGLKLESAKGGVEVIAIDHIERPSEN